MKRIVLLPIIVAIIIMANAVSMAAQISGSLELREIITDDALSEKLEIYGYSIIPDKNFGISGVISVSENYSESYIGPIWMPAPWISLEAGIGLQEVENDSPLRYAAAGWIGNSVGSLYYIREMGSASDDWWEKFRIFANLGELAKVGAVYEKDYDWGPIVEVSIPDSKFKIRATWYPHPDIAYVGLLFNF